MNYKTDPRWHGWATPDQVREMMYEMVKFLEKNGELCPFMIIPVQNVEQSKTFGRELKKTI